jgi:hypothetical protein
MIMAMDEFSLREQLGKRKAQLKAERDKTWTQEWKELARYLNPGAGRFDGDTPNDGSRKDHAIYNSSPLMAVQVLESGMHSGMTNPAMPWFKLDVPDEALGKYGPVKRWLYNAQRAMEAIFVRSNLYHVLPTCYGEQGVFGTGVICALPDDDEVVRFYNFTAGSYMLATSSRQIVDVLYREFHMTPRQMAQQFGEKNLSTTVRNLLQRNVECWIKVCHAIEPNDKRIHGRLDNGNMPYRSVYWEEGDTHGRLLRQSGLKKFNIMAPRWKVTGEAVYGRGPGHVCIGDAKAIQTAELRKAEFVVKGVRPPMTAPAGMQGMPMSMLPGKVTFVPDNQVGQRIEPMMTVDAGWMTPIQNDIQELKTRIDQAFFVDLFLMISRMDSVRTATEIAERKEEKMLMLGPVLERQNDELLDVLIDFTFDRMLEQSMPIWAGLQNGTPLLEPPPQEMAGMDLKVEYTSLLAQANKMLGAGSIERALSFTGNMAASFPDVADNLDTDSAIREYFNAVGTPPTMVRDPDVVQQIREGRAQAQQQAAQEQQLAQIADGAKTLSETSLNGDTALSSILGSI